MPNLPVPILVAMLNLFEEVSQDGWGVEYSLRVREVPGSNPGQVMESFTN